VNNAGSQNVVFDEPVIGLTKGSSSPFDHLRGLVESVDVLDQRPESIGRETVPASNLEYTHVLTKVGANLIELELPLEHVHEVDFVIQSHPGGSFVPMPVGMCLRSHLASSTAAAAMAASRCGNRISA